MEFFVAVPDFDRLIDAKCAKSMTTRWHPLWKTLLHIEFFEACVAASLLLTFGLHRGNAYFFFIDLLRQIIDQYLALAHGSQVISGQQQMLEVITDRLKL